MTTISHLAKSFNVTHRALRFYEGEGLLSPARRGRQRLYSEDDAAKLKIILELKALGFTLAETRNLIGYDMEGRPHVAISPDVARAQLAHMRKQVAEAQDAVTILEGLTGQRSAA